MIDVEMVETTVASLANIGLDRIDRPLNPECLIKPPQLTGNSINDHNVFRRHPSGSAERQKSVDIRNNAVFAAIAVETRNLAVVHTGHDRINEGQVRDSVRVRLVEAEFVQKSKHSRSTSRIARRDNQPMDQAQFSWGTNS